MAFSMATNFANEVKKEVRGNYFCESTLVMLAGSDQTAIFAQRAISYRFLYKNFAQKQRSSQVRLVLAITLQYMFICNQYTLRYV